MTCPRSPNKRQRQDSSLGSPATVPALGHYNTLIPFVGPAWWQPKSHIMHLERPHLIPKGYLHPHVPIIYNIQDTGKPKCPSTDK